MELELPKFRIRAKEIESAQTTHGERVTKQRGAKKQNNVRGSSEDGRRREGPDSVSRFLEDRKVEPELLKFRIRAKENESAQTTLGERVAKQGGAKKTEHRQRK